MNVFKEIRMQKQLTQKDLAKILAAANLTLGEITPDLISRWENGVYYPNLSIRQWYAEHSNIPLSEINRRLLEGLKTPKAQKIAPENQLKMNI